MKDLPLAAAASLYGIKKSALQLISGERAKPVFAFKRGGEEYILRFSTVSREMTIQSQLATISWMGYLAQNGASVPTPVPSEENHLVETASQEEVDWLVVALSRAPGQLSENIPLDSWDGPLFQSLGKSIGKIHSLARKYAPPAGLRRPDWQSTSNLFHRTKLSAPGLSKKQSKVLGHIRKLPPGGDDYGLVHAGLDFDNFIVELGSRKITLFDFDACVYGWFTMDIAKLLFDILVRYDEVDREDFARHFMRNFLSGYKSESSLGIFWLTQVPHFLKLLELNLYEDLHANETDQDVDSSGEKFLQGRKERIEADQAFVDIDFEILAVSRPDTPVFRRRIEAAPTEDEAEAEVMEETGKPEPETEIESVTDEPVSEEEQSGTAEGVDGKREGQVEAPIKVTETLAQFEASQELQTDVEEVAAEQETPQSKRHAFSFWRELRILIAVQLFLMGQMSTERAARLADVPRVEFLLNLGFYKVFPLNSELEDLEREIDEIAEVAVIEQNEQVEQYEPSNR